MNISCFIRLIWRMIKYVRKQSKDIKLLDCLPNILRSYYCIWNYERDCWVDFSGKLQSELIPWGADGNGDNGSNLRCAVTVRHCFSCVAWIIPPSATLRQRHYYPCLTCAWSSLLLYFFLLQNHMAVTFFKGKILLYSKIFFFWEQELLKTNTSIIYLWNVFVETMPSLMLKYS